MSEGFTWHGGRLDEARAHFGSPAEAWIDLSTGINPEPWPGVGAFAADWTALPSPAKLRTLEATAARHFGVDNDHICALPGSEMGLRLLPQVLRLPGFHIAPTYRTHGAVFPQSLVLDDERDLPQSAAALLVANPNNPDGRVHPAATLLDWLERTEQTAGWLLLDEAFADVDPEISLASHVDDARRLILFRSFGKFFGLAGLRLGFVLGPRAIIARYKQLLGDWPVHAGALGVGIAAYDDSKWIEATRQQLRAKAARLDALLSGHRLTLLGQCPLFRLVETDNAQALFERLARRSILTRPFDYAPNWLRLGLPGSEEAWQRLDQALANG
ncbi:threonine-phosphate decarboxylase CobD [Novosphingobium aquimarinum]|uniref:threonine-phosphate decarboxylase CobD n=1 Tax=Novosphingobium aquimarinum TaxID=2682494 RepID=UPI0012EB4BF1|nr:threonine-phosphate decarboxylase CobD [Novosphingobium aquimarinum]